eukprot:241464-Rhodomonas_salina.1
MSSTDVGMVLRQALCLEVGDNEGHVKSVRSNVKKDLTTRSDADDPLVKSAIAEYDKTRAWVRSRYWSTCLLRHVRYRPTTVV